MAKDSRAVTQGWSVRDTMQAIESLFAKLKSECEAYLPSEEVAQIYEAYLVSYEAHKLQKRKSGDPYIIHPVAVTRILAGLHMDKLTLMAALLHDVLEDTPTTKDQLASQFGEEVAELVDGVSKLTQMKFENHVQAQAENFRKMALAMVRDIRVIIIKIADRLHNMRTLSALRPDKQKRIATETLEIYAPIANRLGMHAFRVEYESLSFAALYPMRYRILKQAMVKLQQDRSSMVDTIAHALTDSLQARDIPKFEIAHCERHLYGVYQSMLHRRLSFHEVMDMYRFMITVPDIDVCYRTLGVVHNLFKPVPERFKDYIAIPKANGYQALHTTLFGPHGIPLEVQILTDGMYKMAEMGIASHWLYQSLSEHQEAAADPQKRAKAWLQNLSDIQTHTGSSIEFIENVKTDLFPQEVYVFTPMGTIVELPRGATPVDFAYAIHSDIGNTCVAAKIDRRLCPLNTHLMNGQSVEIITSPNACPNPTWLNFVLTAKARSNIRHFLKQQKRVESINLGRQLLEQAMQSMRRVGLKELEDEHITAALAVTGHEQLDDLLEGIGLGKQVPQVVASHLLSELPIKEKAYPKKSRAKPAKPLLITGSEGMLIQFSSCCKPIPGDLIIGILDHGKGFMIHHQNCAAIEKTCEDAEHCIPVRWEENINGHFSVDLEIEVINQRGALAHITTAIASALADIIDISAAETDAHYHTLFVTLSVRDRIHLARVMRRLRRLKLVHRLTRRHI